MARLLGEYLGATRIEIQGPDLRGLVNEAGGHRIQRVPPTERKGRVHTSTVTVAVLDPAVPQFTVDPKDIRTEWYSGSGAGGQHRNKHQNSCRLTHIPTGIVSTSQCRSRQNSYTEAYETLLQRLDEKYRGAYNAAQSVERKQQVGSGQRGDKIRTYRFQDDQVKDHNTGKSASCSKVLRGHFDLLW